MEVSYYTFCVFVCLQWAVSMFISAVKSDNLTLDTAGLYCWDLYIETTQV